MAYQYVMKQRPFSPGAQPNGARLVQDYPQRTNGIWSIIEYDHMLTQQEIEQYELVEVTTPTITNTNNNENKGAKNMKTTNTNKTTITERIANIFIQALNEERIPWITPWNTPQGYISHVTGKGYSLINSMLIEANAFNKGYKSREYLTYNQALQQGGTVKQGEKGTEIIYYQLKSVVDKDKKANNPQLSDEECTKHIPILRSYTVFCIDQCDGLKDRYKSKAETTEERLNPTNINEQAQSLVDDYGKIVKINHREIARAYYSPIEDTINIPRFEQFPKAVDYYNTAFHEMAHSTGHQSRLNRIKTGIASAAFGSNDYGKEELVAESSATILLTLCGMFATSITQSKAYFQSWANAIKADNNMVISAINQADKAVDFILTNTNNNHLLEQPELITNIPTITKNVNDEIAKHQGVTIQATGEQIESTYALTFTDKPDEQTRTILKQYGFRYNGKTKQWYTYTNTEQQNFNKQVIQALLASNGDTTTTTVDDVQVVDDISIPGTIKQIKSDTCLHTPTIYLSIVLNDTINAETHNFLIEQGFKVNRRDPMLYSYKGNKAHDEVIQNILPYITLPIPPNDDDDDYTRNNIDETLNDNINVVAIPPTEDSTTIKHLTHTK